VSASGLIWERQEESARFDGDVLLTRAGMMLQSVSLEMSTGGSGTRAFNAAGAVRLSDSAWKGSGDRLYTAGGEDVYHLESATGLATVTTLPSGITLKGAHLRVDPETGVAQVDSLPGGRITLSSRNTPVKEQP
jgi:lipopolysaccharide export system protein LptA